MSGLVNPGLRDLAQNQQTTNKQNGGHEGVRNSKRKQRMYFFSIKSKRRSGKLMQNG